METLDGSNPKPADTLTDLRLNHIYTAHICIKQNTQSGHFYLAENRTFLFSVDNLIFGIFFVSD